MLANLLKVSDEELAFTGDDRKTQSPSWMSVLAEQSCQWLKLLPKVIFNLCFILFKHFFVSLD